MAAAIRRALAEHVGSLLAFLPGVAEIERTATGSAIFQLVSFFTASTAGSIPPPSVRRLARRRPGGGSWFSPPRSQRPA